VGDVYVLVEVENNGGGGCLGGDINEDLSGESEGLEVRLDSEGVMLVVSRPPTSMGRWVCKGLPLGRRRWVDGTRPGSFHRWKRIQRVHRKMQCQSYPSW
jgi:hypothetical protein